MNLIQELGDIIDFVATNNPGALVRIVLGNLAAFQLFQFSHSVQSFQILYLHAYVLCCFKKVSL